MTDGNIDLALMLYDSEDEKEAKLAGPGIQIHHIGVEVADRLRVGLNRASKGRMVFIARQNAAMIEQERELKREGVTDTGTVGMTRAQFGADYRLTGNIASTEARDPRTGTMQRYTQIVFEMVDLESGAIEWSNSYEIARAATDDVIYR